MLVAPLGYNVDGRVCKPYRFLSYIVMTQEEGQWCFIFSLHSDEIGHIAKYGQALISHDREVFVSFNIFYRVDMFYYFLSWFKDIICDFDCLSCLV